MEYAALKKEIESIFNRATSLVNYGAYVDWPIHPRIDRLGALVCSGDSRKYEMMLVSSKLWQSRACGVWHST